MGNQSPDVEQDRPGSGLSSAQKSLLALSSNWYWEQDAHFRFTLVIGGAEENEPEEAQAIIGMLRWSEHAWPLRDKSGWEAHKADLAAHRVFKDFVYARRSGKGEVRYISVSGEPVFDAAGLFIGYRGLAKDVTQRIRQEQLLQLEHAVTLRIGEARGTVEAIRGVIRAICESEGWESGDYWQLDHKAGMRKIIASWGIAEPPIQRFIEASQGISLSMYEGQVAETLQSGTPLWFADLSNDRMLNVRGKLMRETGLRALFILPVIVDEQIFSVITFHSRRLREPDAGFVQAVRVIGSQIGQFLQRKQAEETMRESEARFRSLTQLSSDVFWEQDAAYRYTIFTLPNAFPGAPRGEDCLGKQRWDMPYVNMTAEDWVAHKADLDARRVFRDLELCRLDEQGNKIWWSVSGEPMFAEDGSFKGYRGVGKDITGRKENEARIHHLAHHDGLTGLPNRVMFGETLALAMAQSKRHQRKLAVLFIDLDRFKAINDTLGHQAGDMLLREVAARLKSILRSDDVIARLGGDEFVVLLQEIEDPLQVATVCRKILSAAVKPVMVKGHECRVTASVGISMYPADAQDEQGLMRNADIAMYRAKEEGKNNFKFYSERINRHSLESMALETCLRRALERREFSLHYQAKCNLQTGRITGVEALLRWRHPELGLVPPMEFLSIAEQTGLILPIGRWVLNAACAQSVAWQREGLPAMRMAVNISAHQFADDYLPRDIERAIAGSGIRPDLLELELSEQLVTRDVERALTMLNTIKRLGVRVAIDVFGIGYATLGSLPQLPVDTLKIGRSFLQNLQSGQNGESVAEAIIAMGKTLNLTVVAEGVETHEQQRFLRECACDEMQGFYFSKPIDERQFAAFLRRNADEFDAGRAQ